MVETDKYRETCCIVQARECAFFDTQVGFYKKKSEIHSVYKV